MPNLTLTWGLVFGTWGAKGRQLQQPIFNLRGKRICFPVRRAFLTCGAEVKPIQGCLFLTHRAIVQVVGNILVVMHVLLLLKLGNSNEHQDRRKPACKLYPITHQPPSASYDDVVG
jgi:hypothetical protein